MSGLSLKSTFGAVTLGGLIEPGALARLMVGMFADEDVREALSRAVDATEDLGAGSGASAQSDARSRLDDALDTLTREIERRDTTVKLEPEEARRLRELLIAARLGQGRADAWPAYRRTAA